MEKDPCTKFCGVLINCHEVVKLQSFETDLCDGIPANVQNISLWFSLYSFLNFMERELSKTFSVFFFFFFNYFSRADEVLKFE